MKILELTNFSAGACGVWTRVFSESKELTKLGYKVKVFSSNATKGSSKLAPSKEVLEDIEVTRFPFRKLGGESFMSWKFKKEALEFKPDIIIAHVYRHLHTTKAIKVAKQLKKQGHDCKLFLVTHAPFIENDSTRSIISKLAVKFYDFYKGPRTINKFDKIIVITQWEIPYLEKLGIKKDKIVYIPNGVPEVFFTQKPSKEENKLLFFGRISPIKDIETLIKSMPLINNKKVILEIVGPAEESYLNILKQEVKQISLEKHIIFSAPIYELDKKIKKVDSAKIFVLPSKRDAMPQALIEAMARGKLAIASKTQGGKEIITDKKDGLLFDIGDEKQLAETINFVLENQREAKKIAKNARKSAEKYKWSKLIKDLIKLF